MEIPPVGHVELDEEFEWTYRSDPVPVPVLGDT